MRVEDLPEHSEADALQRPPEGVGHAKSAAGHLPGRRRYCALHKGQHLLADCRNVSQKLCLDDQLVLEVMARAAQRAGSKVISQIRYKFGEDSPPGFAAIVMLDESHCSAHTYAEEGLIAMDIFTCGGTDPREVFRYIREELDLGDVSIKEFARFRLQERNSNEEACANKASVPGRSGLT